MGQQQQQHQTIELLATLEQSLLTQQRTLARLALNREDDRLIGESLAIALAGVRQAKKRAQGSLAFPLPQAKDASRH